MFFSKYVGAGNDFIIIDNRTLTFPSHDHLFISRLCERTTGIGADGLILLENSKTADYKMRIFNSDGFEAEMCGNGIRCFFKFLQECEKNISSCVVETKEAKIELTQDEANESFVKVKMQEPFDMRWNLNVDVDSKTLTLHHLNTGVPHLVIFSDSVKDHDLTDVAPKLRYHESFLPKGANVNFATVTDNSNLSIRTYERGVENETLGCGTGATACALAAACVLDMLLPIHVKTRSGEEIKIHGIIENRKSEVTIKEVTMTGKAHLLYKGKLANTI